MPLDKDSRKKFLQKIGAQIVEIRIKKGISSAELARRCDLDPPNITRIEKGRVNIGIVTLQEICTALEIKIEDFFADLHS